MSNIDSGDSRPVIPLGRGDPSAFPCFRTTPVADEAIVSAVTSAKYNCYSPTVGILPARRAIADYLNRDLPYKLSPDDVFLTLGCSQAIEVILAVLARPKANILLPRPGFPFYEARAAYCGLEVRHFDLLPDQNWEVDLGAVRALADKNTVAMVIINPGNPCGNVFTYQHLSKVAETAKELEILVIADEVYEHITFATNPFVPMGTFGSVVPVVTLGSLSKRWLVPGWRMGWLVTSDTHGVLKETKIVDSIKSVLDITSEPATFIQGALPEILENTTEDFFSKTIETLKITADICNNKIKEINCISCPKEPEGSMFLMVKLNLSLLEGIKDDMDFCLKLAKEESVVILPGICVGLKGWLRLNFAVEPSCLEDGLERLKSFCQRYQKV
ncbi:nicotianamine aminotransferase 1-like [Aristolochia californica]|uniref:nicotianamine aminotransferase 1-like n=1 Tax=Aristolochia californica TaxID=171875 RepID=UPI0035E013C2